MLLDTGVTKLLFLSLRVRASYLADSGSLTFLLWCDNQLLLRDYSIKKSLHLNSH
jgi:hypothetical protein